MTQPWPAIAALRKMPEDGIFALIRDRLAEEAARIDTLERQLVALGQRMSNDRHELVLVLDAACDCFGLLIATKQEATLRNSRDGPPALIRLIANQSRAALMADGLPPRDAVDAGAS